MSVLKKWAFIRQTDLLNCNYSLFCSVNVSQNHFIALNTAWEWPIYRHGNMWKMMCFKSREVRRTQMLQSGYCGGGGAAGDNLPVDFQFMTSFCSLFHFATQGGCIPRLIPNSVTNSEMVGILGGLINRFPSCQYCCVDIASHSTSPISLDRAFHSCKCVRVRLCRGYWGVFWCQSPILLIHTASLLCPLL